MISWPPRAAAPRRPLRRLPAVACIALLAAACPATSYTPGVLPRSLEGFRLGESLRAAQARLREAGWKVTLREQQIGRARVIQARARRPGDSSLQRITLRAVGGRVASIRVAFDPASYDRGKRIAAVCTPENLIAGAGYYVQCMDRKKRIVLTARKEGSRATLMDLRALVAAGVVSQQSAREQLERSLSRLARAMSGASSPAPVGGARALPEEIEGFRLGTPLREVLDRLRPSRWAVRLRARRRHNVRYRQIEATSLRPSPILELKLSFYQRRLAQVRVYYRRSDTKRFRRLVDRCRGHLSIAVRLGYRGCRDRGWTRFFGMTESGTFVRLLDLATSLRAGVITRSEVGGKR